MIFFPRANALSLTTCFCHDRVDASLEVESVTHRIKNLITTAMSSDEDIAMNSDADFATQNRLKGKGRATEPDYTTDENLPWCASCVHCCGLADVCSGSKNTVLLL